MSKLDKSITETPDNKILRAIFGPDISLKEVLVVVAAGIIIFGFIAG